MADDWKPSGRLEQLCREQREGWRAGEAARRDNTRTPSGRSRRSKVAGGSDLRGVHAAGGIR